MTTTYQDICQFAPTANRGDAALNLGAGGGYAIAVQISPNQATALKAGDFVKFDSTQTIPGLPWVVAAADNEIGIGVLQRNLKASSFSAGDACDLLANIGPVSVQVAAGTVTPGSQLETASGAVQVVASNPPKFLCLDYATSGMTCRCAVLPPVVQ